MASGKNDIQVSGLIPGNTYTFVAVPAAETQKASFILSLTDKGMEMASHPLSRNDRPQMRRFKATSATTWIRVDAATKEQTQDIPMYLSMLCEECERDNTWIGKFNDQVESLANITTVGGVSASSLVTNTLIGGNCFDVANVTSTGPANSRGTFANGAASINIANGVVMCTGNVNTVSGPNNQNGASGNTAGFNTNSADDPDLATLSSGNQWDVSKIEFDFTPTANMVQFDYVFGSEEYCEYVNSAFNDVFGFFISGPGITGVQNIALIPMTSTPITINNVNHLLNSAYYVNNNNYGGGPGPSCAAQPVFNAADCQLDGWTTVLTATAQLTACSTYHIKLAIADIADGAFASAVFLKAQSFDAGGIAKALPVYPAGQNFIYEGCSGGYIKFVRGTSDVTQPLVVTYTIDGSSTATPGADYTPLTGTVTIPAGATEILVPITAFADGLVEGQESIVILLSNPCTCTQQPVTILINDKPPIEVDLEDHTQCGGSTYNLTPTITGGLTPYTYHWNTGATTAGINIPAPGGTYTVTVTDNCGETMTASATVNLLPVPTANLTGTGYFCVGATPTPVNLTLTMTGTGPWDVTYNAAGNTITQTFTSSPTIIPVTDPGSYSLVSVTSSNGCTGTVTGNVNLVQYDVNLNLNPTSPPCGGTNNGSIVASASGGTTPYTYVWNTGANGANYTGLAGGTYTVTVTDNKGCTETATATLDQPPPLTASVVSSSNIDCNNPQGNADLDVGGGTPGYVFNWSNGSHSEDPIFTSGGTFTVTVTDTHGCTKTATATITANTTLPTAVVAPPQQLNCNNQIVTLNGTGSSTGANFTYQWGGPGFVCCETTLQPQVNQGGTYTLTVTNTATGCTKTVSVTVVQTTTPPPAVATPSSNIGCATPNVTLSGAGSATGAGITYQWSANPGNITGSTTTINTTANQAGTYTLVVTNSNTGCTNSATVTITGDTQLPTAAVAPPITVDCNNPSITLDGSGSSQGGNFTYNWTPAGLITGGQGTLNPTTSSGGTFTLVVTNTSNGCTSSATVTVAANQTLPNAVATAPQQVDCTHPTVSINGTGSSTGANFSYQWSANPGTITGGGQTLNPTVSSGGSYTLTVTNSTNGCTKTVTVNVNENTTPPTVNAGPDLQLNCAHATVQGQGSGSSGGGFTLQWSPAPASGSNSYTPTFNAPGTYTLTVTNSANGCTSVDDVTITSDFNLPTAVIAPPITVDCSNPSITLDGSGSSQGGNFTYNWTPAGLITGGQGTLTPTTSSGGTFTLVVTNTSNGCTSTATVTTTTNLNLPTAVATAPQQVDCTHPTVSINGTGSSTGPNFSYQWSANPGTITGGDQTLNPTVSQGGSYTLTVTNSTNGCTKTVTVNVNENTTPPTVNAGPDLQLDCTHMTIQGQGNGSSGGNFTLQWSPAPASGSNSYTPTFNAPGTYTLTVTNSANGCTSVDDVTVVSDFNLPTATIAPPITVNCYNPQVTLDGSGSSQGGSFTYNWTPAGLITSGQGTLTPTTMSGGTFTLVVTNTSNGCTSTATVTTVADLGLPTAVATAPQQVDCNHPNVNINGTGSSSGPNFTYQWSANPGNIVTGDQTLMPTVDQGGTYTLVVTNSTNGCTKSVTVPVNENLNYPTVNAGAPQTLNCYHPTVTLAGSGSSGSNINIQWTANPGNITSGANTYMPVVNQAGLYTIVVTNTSNGCSSTDFVPIDLDFTTPDAQIAPPQVLTCDLPEFDLNAGASTQGPDIQYSWTTVNGHIVNGANTPTPTIDDPGTYTLLVTNITSGCTDQAQVTVTQNITPPVANAGPNAQISCTQPTAILNGGGSSTGSIYTYEWMPQPGNIVSGQFGLSPTIDEPGTYILVVTNTTNGCTAQDAANVIADQSLPHATAGPDLVLDCHNFTIHLIGTGSSTGASFTYLWTANPGHIVSGATTLSPIVDQAGAYTLLITNTSNGCTDTDEVWVDDNIVYPIAAIAPAQQLNCTNTTIELDAGGSSQGNNMYFNWTTINGNIVGGNGSPNPEVDEPGTYNLVLTNQDNFCTATASVTVSQNTTLPTAIAANPAPITCQFPQTQLSGQGSSQGPEFFYLWTTTNGHIVSGELTLTPTVNQPGTYLLTVFNNDNGCENTTTATVTTSQTFPTANAGPTASITCAASQLTLDGTGSSQGSQYAYVWSTQNGNIVSGTNTLNPVVNAPGTYDLSVINNQTGCASTSSVIIGLNIGAPTALAAPGGVLSCTVNSLQLDGNGSSTGANFSYLWTTVNGNILSGNTTLTPTVNAVGSYTLQVLNSVNGCSTTVSTNVTADASVPVANAGPADTLTCTITQLTLNGGGSSQGNQFTYQWGGPGVFSGGTTLAPVINAAGQYSLLVTNTSNGCTAISAVNIPSDTQHPNAEAGPPAELTCTNVLQTLDGSSSSSGGAFTYNWNTSNGHIVSGANTLTPQVDMPGSYSLTVTNTSNGCTTTDLVAITQDIALPTADAGLPGLITCTNPTVTLQGTGSSGANFGYQWSTPDGNIASGPTTLSPVVDAPGTYNLLITNTHNGCTATDLVAVAKDANVPTAAVAAPNELNCVVHELQLDGTGSSQGANIQYTWTTSNGSFSGPTNTLTPLVNGPGQYTLNIHNTTNNCDASSTITVNLNVVAPTANAGSPQVISCFFPILTLDGNGSSVGSQYSYEWQTINGHLLSGGTTLTPQIDQSGFYDLVVTDESNGCTALSTVQILLDQNTPEADAGTPQTLNCQFSSLQLNGTGSSSGSQFTFQWTASNGGNIVSGDNTLTPTIDDPGTYTLLVSNPSNGCTAQALVVVDEDVVLPAALAAAPPVLNCQLTQTPLDASASSKGNNFVYQWAAANGGSIVSDAQTLAPIIDAPGQYTLTVTNTTNHCTATVAVDVQEDVVYPTVDAGPTSTLTCTNTSATLTGTVGNAGNSYQTIWTTGNGSIVSGENTLNPVVNAPGTYVLTITNPNNFCSSTDQVFVGQDASLPTANAGPSPTLTCAITEATLSGFGSSSGPQFTYLWTTTDGEIISGETTLFPTIGAPGTYVLLVTNIQNQCATPGSVIVNENVVLPNAEAGQTATLTCTQPTLQLNGAGSSVGAAFTYDWTTSGNGNIISGNTTLTPLIGAPGQYQLQVTDQQNGCTQTDIVNVLADNNAPIAVASTPGEITCTNPTRVLSGAGSSQGNNFTYQWTTGNGNIISGAATLSLTVGAPGLYTLEVTNTANGCKEQADATVTQNTQGPTANAGTDNLLTCAITQLTLSGQGTGGVQGVSYTWAASNGGHIVGGAATPTPTIDAGGTYTLTITDLYNGCTNTDILQTNTDVVPPTVAIAPPGLLTCVVFSVTLDGQGSSQGPQFSYVWTGPGIVSGGNTLTPTVDQPGVYSLQIQNSSNGCSNNSTSAVSQNVILPDAEAGNGFEITCSVQQSALSTAGSSSGAEYGYTWTTPDGNIVSGANTGAPIVDAVGTYNLLVTNNLTGCTATDLTTVTENTNYPSDLSLFTEKPKCGNQGGTIRFEEVEGGVGPYTYSIDGGQHFMAANEFGNLTPGTYNLVVQDVNGCLYDEELTFPVPVEPAVAIDPEIQLQFGESATLKATFNIPFWQVDTIIWSPLENLTLTNNMYEVIARPFQTTRYTVTLINIDGCQDEAELLVRVSDPAIWAPNAISPNTEDGQNDVFNIFARDNTVSLINTLQIYDRWGNQVFQAKDGQPNDPQFGWDGRFRGKMMNPAVFVWWAEVTLVSGQKILMKGDVTIVQ